MRSKLFRVSNPRSVDIYGDPSGIPAFQALTANYAIKTPPVVWAPWTQFDDNLRRIGMIDGLCVVTQVFMASRGRAACQTRHACVRAKTNQGALMSIGKRDLAEQEKGF
jgi:hypothetical protein